MRARASRDRTLLAGGRAIALALTAGLGLACRAPAPVADPEVTAPPPPLAPALGATAAQLCASGPREWRILDTGRAIGRTRGSCVGEEEPGWHFVSQVQLGDAIASELHLWLGDDGAPRQAELRRADQLAITVSWNEGAVVVERDGDRATLRPNAGEVRPLWALPAHAIYVRELMLRLGVGVGPAAIDHVGFAPDTGVVHELQLNVGRDPAQGRLIAVGELGRARLSPLRGDGPTPVAELRVEAIDDADGRPRYVAELEAEPWSPSLPRTPRPIYALPADLVARPFVLAGAGVAPDLAGELVLAGDRADGPEAAGTARRPLALVLTGAGAHDRHGFAAGAALDVGYHRLHDALARGGFAVVRYDDRGTGQSTTGAILTPGYDDLVEDAARVVAAALTRPEVDPARFVLIGHGEGALTATRLAREGVPVGGRRVRPSALVLWGAPGRPMRALLRDSVAGRLRDASPDEQRLALAELARVHDAIERDRELPADVEPLRLYLRQLFAIDPLALLRATKLPVLAIQGERDAEVDATIDLPAILAVIRGRPHSEARALPGLDHGLAPIEGAPASGPRIDGAAVAAIVAWASARAGLNVAAG